jgi:hypothetical protein
MYSKEKAFGMNAQRNPGEFVSNIDLVVQNK